MKTEWKEASFGTISFFDAYGERLSTTQYGRMPEHKKITLKTLLRKHTEEILLLTSVIFRGDYLGLSIS